MPWAGCCPQAIQALRALEFGRGSQINVPIAVLIWLMITPMMMKVDFTAIRNVGRRPAGLAVTLAVNWLIKPFSMALLAWFFFRLVFSPLDQRPPRPTSTSPGALCSPPRPAPRWSSSGAISPAATPRTPWCRSPSTTSSCWSLFVPIVRLLVTGASSLEVPFGVLLWSVIVFIVIPLAAGTLLRMRLIASRGRAWFEGV